MKRKFRNPFDYCICNKVIYYFFFEITIESYFNEDVFKLRNFWQNLPYNQTNKNIFALLPDAADAMRGYLPYC